MKKRRIPFLIGYLVLLASVIYFTVTANWEFLLYALVHGILIYALDKTDNIFKYTSVARWGFITWLLLHLGGGILYFNGIRLYDILLIDWIGSPYHLLKYDQVMHIIAYFVMTLFIYSWITYVTKDKAEQWVVLIIALAAGTGLGSIYESIEFSTVILFQNTGVGDYFNNALDLVFNFLGALLAVLYIPFTKK